jgi:N-acetyl sugar amidotransferase
MVTMSRNLLPFDWQELRRYGWSSITLKLIVLRYTQTRTFRGANGVIFLTEYARQIVEKVTGQIADKTAIIPHGVNPRFQIKPREQRAICEYTESNPYRLLYVSIIDQYKHQWHVVEAVHALRQEGYPILLELVGMAYPPSLTRLQAAIARFDPEGRWVRYHGTVPYEGLHQIYRQADLGIFASSCENMPNILLETMAAGLPIACSSRPPMPEFLKDAGVYFDPESPAEIVDALRKLIASPELRAELSTKSYGLASVYTWDACAENTFRFLKQIARPDSRLGIVIGVDASRNRSGGAKNHLVGLIQGGDPRRFGIEEVHVWAYRTLLDALPDQPWLVKHNPAALEGTLLRQVWWQIADFPREFKAARCDILLNTDAGTLSSISPCVTMSRDMLSYEPGEIERYGWSKARARLILLRWIQNWSLRRADGVIFLTRHASTVIQESCGTLGHVAIIPHGIGDVFRSVRRTSALPDRGEREINCLYVSNAAPYKHQWMVVKAVEMLRAKGYPLKLTLVGGGSGKAQARLDAQIALSDPNRQFVVQKPFVAHDQLPGYLAAADIFVFASSCENMPNTLLEAMAAGLPIACSQRGPMPEVLGNGGVYFDPEAPASIADAIQRLLDDEELRHRVGLEAKRRSMEYSWARCANETWSYLQDTRQRVQAGSKRGRAYQVCTNCVMDISDERIVFDEHGICDHCNTFYKVTLKHWHTDARGQAELDRMVDRIRKSGKGKDFDCIIGLSGGIDSSYLAYIAKEKLGLRPLVFHVDAGWNSDIAVNNIEKLVDGLGLDLFTEVIDWEEMKDLQLAFFRAGVPHIDAPQDHAFFAAMYKFAVRYGVKYILTGANLSTECIRNPIEWMYYQSDSWQLRDIHRQFGSRPLKNFPVTSISWHKIWLPYFRGIRVLRPLNYIPYVKEEAQRLLIDRFGWQRYPQKHFESRFTRFYESYWLPVRFGYDVRRVQYSSLILTGQMTRDEALERLKQPPYDPATIAQEIEFVANKLGISVDELNSYMRLPKRTYRDFKSQRLIYDIGSRVMKLFRMEIGGKR